MTTPPPNPLQQAAAYLRAGQRAEARALLAQYVRQNPSSENAWLMLSLALDDRKQQTDCLNIVLRINPNNAEARERLDKLTQAPPAPAPPPPPAPLTSAQVESIAPPQPESSPAPPTEPPPPPAPEAVPAQPPPPPAPEIESLGPPPAPTAKPFYTGPLQDILEEDAAASTSPAQPPESQQAEATPAQSTTAPAPAIAPSQAQAPASVGPVTTMPSVVEADDSTAAEFTPLIVPTEPGTPAAPPLIAPRRSNPLTCVLAVVLTGTLLVVISVIAVSAYLTFTQQPTPTAVAASTKLPTVDLTGLAFPTIPPSYTPSATPTITLTPTITPTLTTTPIPTPQQPGDGALAQMQTIEQQVIELRGLTAPEALQRNVIDSRNVRATLEDLYLANGGTREALDDQVRVLAALGLVRSDFDLLTPTLNSLSDSPDGFYLPQAKGINMVGADFGNVQQWVYAYEYDHALVDAKFDVAGMDITPVCKGDRQRCDAVRALIVGDAMLSMAQWFKQNGSPEDATAFNNYDLSEPILTLLSTPPFILRQMAFAYVEGKQFVESLFNEGGWERVNSAYAAPPLTTEYILHPDKYLASEPPIQVESPTLESAIGDEWRPIGSDSLGEWTTFLILSAGLNRTAQVEEETGRQAAAGWGGDVYQAYYNSRTNQTILVVHWAWDSAQDADEFLAAMRTHLDALFDGAKIDRSNGDCWEKNGQASCMFAAGVETLWILAPDQPAIDNILSRFPTFQ